MNSYGRRTSVHVAVRRLHLHREAVLGAVPDLELVLGEVDDPVADDVPLDVVHELARRDAAARVDAAEDPAGVVLVLGTLLARVPGRDADAAARARERRVDPAGDRARVVVRVAVRAEADVDRDRLPLAVGDGEQVVDRMGEPRRVVERPAPVELVLRNGDQDRHDPCAAADAAVPRGDARNVRAVGAGGHLRLRLQHVRGQALARRCGDRRVEVGGHELGAIVERRGLALGGRRPRVAALVPDREEPRLPVRDEVGVREVEAPDVDDADQHVGAVAMLGGVPEPAQRRCRCRHGARLDRRRRQRQRLAHLDVGHLVALGEVERLLERELGGAQPASGRRQADAGARRELRVQLAAAEADEDAHEGVGVASEVSSRDLRRLLVLSRGDRVVRANRRERSGLLLGHRHRAGVLGAQDVHLGVAVGDHAQLRLHLAQAASVELHATPPSYGNPSGAGAPGTTCLRIAVSHTA